MVGARVSYASQDIVEVLRTLEELVISLDRIGSRSSDLKKAEFDAILSSFIEEHDVFKKAARARQVLSEVFDSNLGPDGLSELERLMQGVGYWERNL